MDSMTKVLLGFLLVVLTCTVCNGLQCYACRGITHMDENGCVHPEAGRTTQQECRRTDSCEKRIKRIDKHHAVIERGCSANCDGRDFIWNMDFHVHCCDNTNLCNSARGLSGDVTTRLLTLSAAMVALCAYRYLRL